MTGAISIYCYQEALAIIGENKPVLLALAQALIDHPERTLNAAEIDAVISQTLAREALAAEQGRRAVWRRTIENAASFGDPLGCNTWGSGAPHQPSWSFQRQSNCGPQELLNLPARRQGNSTGKLKSQDRIV
jgi:hypothetical protein